MIRQPWFWPDRQAWTSMAARQQRDDQPVQQLGLTNSRAVERSAQLSHGGLGRHIASIIVVKQVERAYQYHQQAAMIFSPTFTPDGSVRFVHNNVANDPAHRADIYRNRDCLAQRSR